MLIIRDSLKSLANNAGGEEYLPSPVTVFGTNARRLGDVSEYFLPSLYLYTGRGGIPV